MSRDWRLYLFDVLAHAYFALDDATLWKIIRVDVPKLYTDLEVIERETRWTGSEIRLADPRGCDGSCPAAPPGDGHPSGLRRASGRPQSPW